MGEEQSPWLGPEGPGDGYFLGHLPGMHLFDIRCGIAQAGWTGVACVRAYQIVLVRSGGYLRWINGEESFVDTTSALVLRSGDEIRVAHPLGCGDTYTALQYDEPPDLDLHAGEHVVSDEFDLQHRALVFACRTGLDAFELAERVELVLTALAHPEGERSSRGVRPGTRQAHERLVDHAVEALLCAGFDCGLDEIAALVGASPHHLSRVFHRVTGTTLTAYRNRLRVRAVLADLQDGEDSLRALAAKYSFADQSHLTRVVRRQLGQAPSELRAILR